ncbi:MAG TPA: cohesin domain-containing protein, partial [Candidatus Saccharimonadales bacterium]|nr:cohesin domain-containing protein [Candidatus Saccharimonadales bacterium]
MKKQHLISTVTTFFVATVVAMSLVSHKALAATGQIYLSPASLSVQNGNNVTLNLRINPGTTINGVQATVNFDTSALQYVSVSTASSAFSVQLQQSQSGGAITVARGDLSGGISSDSLVESITFKALASSGTSSVTLSGANATDQATSTYTNPSVVNATVNFTAGSCPDGQTGTPPNCTTPTPPPSGGGTGGGSGGGSGSTKSGGSGNTGSNGGSKKPVTKPSSGTEATPTVVGAPATQFTTASVSATTQVPTQVYLIYGTNANTLDQKTALSSFATSHNISLADAHLTPGETYYYIVVSKD